MTFRPLLLLITVLTLTSCSGPGNHDPFEPFNRPMFAFNQTADQLIIRPVAEAYHTYIPQLIQSGISNMLTNITMLPSSLFYVVQGKFHEANVSAQRFLINSTFGILGFFDAASNFEIYSIQSQNLDQTLKHWGYTPSNFVVLPLFGATTVRGIISFPVDSLYLNPTAYLDYFNQYAPYIVTGTGIISKRAQYLQQDNLINDSTDPYATYRSIYTQVDHSPEHLEDQAAAAALFAEDE